ncbi:hypothetical protein D3H55_06540 [Bacillus salacetis]|uniref:Uncharacterized protein n=1 Tax=Bacillus salacetis TaxID=2315464 RepID=A0A3A1R8H0_9BACI|nr:hypothetical protein D3H55_06540 [Bacillus salacetis]
MDMIPGAFIYMAKKVNILESGHFHQHCKKLKRWRNDYINVGGILNSINKLLSVDWRGMGQPLRISRIPLAPVAARFRFLF